MKFASCLLLAISLVLPTAFGRQPISNDPEKAAPAIPQSPAGKQLAWFLDVLNGKAELGDPAAHFTEKFLAAVPPDKLAQTFASIKSSVFKDGAKLTRIKPDATDNSLVAVVQGGDTPLEVSVTIAASGKMDGLLLKPALPPKVALASWMEFDDKFAAFPGTHNFGVYSVTMSPGGKVTLKPLHVLNPDLCLATGSTFKLYILGTLSEQILAGKAKWDEKLAIQENLKSLPGGVMQDEPNGKEFPISEFAAKMISISDNTATDHLLTRAGRENVEKYLSGFNSCAPRSIPFLKTMEMFRIKLAPDRTLAVRYAGADEAARRALLAGEVSKVVPDLAFAEKWTVPIEIDKVEWFSSPHDLCMAMAKLHEMELKPGMSELNRVLRINGGIPFDKKTWPSVAYKGGSEPGVMNLTWLMERSDGALFAVSMGWNNPKAEVDPNTMVALARGMVDLLAKEPK